MNQNAECCESPTTSCLEVITLQFLQNVRRHSQPQHEEGGSKAKTVRRQVEVNVYLGDDTARYKVQELINSLYPFPNNWSSIRNIKEY